MSSVWLDRPKWVLPFASEIVPLLPWGDRLGSSGAKDSQTPSNGSGRAACGFHTTTRAGSMPLIVKFCVSYSDT
jgi:hypothetical protein